MPLKANHHVGWRTEPFQYDLDDAVSRYLEDRLEYDRPGIEERISSLTAAVVTLFGILDRNNLVNADDMWRLFPSSSGVTFEQSQGGGA